MAEAAFQKGIIQFKSRKYGAAIESFSIAIQNNPNHRDAYRYRSQAYFRRGYDDQADADFRRMRDLDQQANYSTPKESFTDSRSCASTWQCKHTLSRHTAAVSAIALTRDSKKILSGSYDKTLRLWSIKTGSLLKTFSGHTQEIHCVAVSWDGKHAASGSADKTIKIWDIRTGELLRSLGNLLSSHSETVTALAFSPNNQILVSASLDKTMRLWSLKSGKELYRLKDCTAPIFAVAMSWDGKTIVHGKGNLIAVHHTKTGKLLRSYSSNNQPGLAIALNRQGSLLATSHGTKIILWNHHAQKKLFQLKGHFKTVSTLAFSSGSPDNPVLVSGSHDKTIRLWHGDTGENTETLMGHQAAVNSVACSPNGTLIVSGSTDKTIKIWQQR